MSLALKPALPDEIETPRLVMRAPRRTDLDALVALADNVKLYAVLARLPHPYTRADGLGFITRIVPDPTEAIYALTTRDRVFLGVAGLTLSQESAPELGYWLGEPYWGKGYATEGVGALLDAATATGLVAQFTARCLASNTGSRRVLEKLGFTTVEEKISSCGPHADVPVISLVCARQRVAA